MSLPPWFELPKPTKTGHIVVIGAGLAGAACAYTLALTGHQVTVLDSADEIGTGASGNPYALLKPFLTVDHNTLDQFYTNGFSKTLDILKELQIPKKSGILALLTNETAIQKAKYLLEKRNPSPALARLVHSNQASDIANTSISHPCLYYPSACMLSIKNLTQALLSHANITLKLTQNVSSIAHQNNIWHMYDNHTNLIETADTLVACLAMGTLKLEQFSHLPLIPTAGQITKLPVSHGNPQLNCGIVNQGHISPTFEGNHYLGATYRLKSTDVRIKSAEHLDNLNAALNSMPKNFLNDPENGNLTGWCGVRATTQDHLPIVGPAPIHQQYLADYHDLKKGKKPETYPNASYYPNLYISTGHGSRGLSSCFLSAELISNLLTNQALDHSEQTQQSIHPARFIVRGLYSN